MGETGPLGGMIHGPARDVTTPEPVILSSRGVAARTRGVVRSIDPVAVAIVVVAATVYTLHGFQSTLNADNGLYAYGAQQALAGVPPYESIFNITGPLAYLLPVPGAVFARVVGIEDLTGIRLFLLGLSALVVSTIYLLAHDLFRSRATAVAAAASFLTFYAFLHNATAGPREKTAMLLFLVLALLGTVRRRWFLAGMAGALATLVWQPAGLIPVAIVAARAIGAPPRDRWHDIGAIMLGGAVPVGVIVIYYALEGALRALLDGFLLVNLRYTATSSESFFEQFWQTVRVVRRGYYMSAWIIATGLIAMAGVILWRLRAAADWRGLLQDRFLVILIAFPLCVAWTAYDFQGPPDLFFVLPFAALGIGALVYSVERVMSASFGRAAAALVTTGAIVLASWSAVARRDHGLIRQHRSIAQMLAQVPPDARMMSIGAPQAMVVSGRTNPNRYQILLRGLDEHLHATWPGGMEGFVNDLEDDPPEVIAFGHVTGARSEVLKRWMYQNYVQRGRAPGWEWLVHRSIAERVHPVSGRQ